MKKIYKKYTTALLASAALMLAACIQDDYAAREKATVQVTFTTRAISNPTANAGGLETHEHMRTLRVIVARSSNSEILYNVKYDIAENETSKTITFSELTVNADGENFDFYTIANEEGTGYTDWDDVTVGTLGNRVLNNIATLNAGNTRIPQTAKTTINVKAQEGGGIQQETIQLKFAVAKVRLTINNTTAAAQTVSDISLSGVDMTSTPLFEGTSLSNKTDGTVALGTMTNIPAEGSSTVYAYFYENTNGSYNLTAMWENKTETFDINTLGNISEIKRGTELDITITIRKTVTTPEDFFIQVNAWESSNNDIPAFE